MSTPAFLTTVRLMIALLLLLAPPALAAPGARDRGFGDRGVATANGLEAPTAITVERDGHLLVAGGTEHPGVVRLTPHGRRDRAFGTRGVLAPPALAPATPLGVLRGPDRRIRLAVTTLSTTAPPVTLVDATAAGRAPRLHPFPGFLAGPLTYGALRPDGGAVVATPFGVLTAVRSDGTPDPGFDGDGQRDLCPPGQECRVTALAAAGDGGVVVSIDRGLSHRIARLDARGVIRWSKRTPAAARTLHARRDGTVLVGFYATRALGRITPDRRRLRRWVVPSAPSRSPVGIDAITSDARGRIYVLQQTVRNERNSAAAYASRVLRFSAAGRPHRGYVAHVPRSRDPHSAVLGTTLALDRRGGLLVGGALYDQGSTDPTGGCDYREDTCATDVRLRVWRFRR